MDELSLNSKEMYDNKKGSSFLNPFIIIFSF